MRSSARCEASGSSWRAADRVRLSTRTGLAALAAAALSVVVLTVVATVQFQGALRDRVDEQLRDRAESASILAAVADRLSVSELTPTIEPARVVLNGETVEIGHLPDEPLPPVTRAGWRTVTAGGEQWRLYAIEVDDVPAVGDSAIVELAAPLGDVDAHARRLRRRAAFAGIMAAIVAGLAGWLFGKRAARPLDQLRADAATIGDAPSDQWSVQRSYGIPEVDDVAHTLNENLERLRGATARRDEALAAARSFSASATHELRTPLQSAMTNLDVALTGAADDDRTSATRFARADLTRMASSLAAVRALSDAELVDATWFQRADLADVVEAVVAQVGRTSGATIGIRGDESAVMSMWSDGVELAVGNLVRNAVAHGRPGADTAPSVTVTIEAATGTIQVDDNGPGIPASERERVVQPFERGSSPEPGSGLGLAFADRVARAHGGRLVLGDAPGGGLRARLELRTGA